MVQRRVVTYLKSLLFDYCLGPGEFVLQPTQLDANDVIDQNVTSGERENEQVQQRFTLDLGTPGITRRLGQRKER